MSEDYWKASEALGMEDSDSYPYPEAAEIPEIRAAYDNLFEVIETREDESGNVPMFMRRSGAAPRGLSEARVRATVNRFFKRYPGADDVRVEIHNTAATLPGFDPARDGNANISGQYVGETDTVHLVRAAYDSESAIREALQEEILVHKGLGFFKSEDIVGTQIYRYGDGASDDSTPGFSRTNEVPLFRRTGDPTIQSRQSNFFDGLAAQPVGRMSASRLRRSLGAAVGSRLAETVEVVQSIRDLPDSVVGSADHLKSMGSAALDTGMLVEDVSNDEEIRRIFENYYRNGAATADQSWRTKTRIRNSDGGPALLYRGGVGELRGRYFAQSAYQSGEPGMVAPWR